MLFMLRCFFSVNRQNDSMLVNYIDHCGAKTSSYLSACDPNGSQADTGNSNDSHNEWLQGFNGLGGDG